MCSNRADVAERWNLPRVFDRYGCPNAFLILVIHQHKFKFGVALGLFFGHVYLSKEERFDRGRKDGYDNFRENVGNRPLARRALKSVSGKDRTLNVHSTKLPNTKVVGTGICEAKAGLGFISLFIGHRPVAPDGREGGLGAEPGRRSDNADKNTYEAALVVVGACPLRTANPAPSGPGEPFALDSWRRP